MDAKKNEDQHKEFYDRIGDLEKKFERIDERMDNEFKHIEIGINGLRKKMNGLIIGVVSLILSGVLLFVINTLLKVAK